MLEALDADAVRRWSRIAVDLLAEHSAEIDALNVFPVADSDTGSNTLTTLRGGDDALRNAVTPTAAAALIALADGAARSALGNSGFLLSQVLRGLADAAGAASSDHPGGSHSEGIAPSAGMQSNGAHADRTAASGAASVAAGLALGAKLARAAVVTPIEGTILSVAEAAAEAAAADAADGLAAMMVGVVQASDAALARTPSQLPDLARAGVVDAGGRALLVVLAALARVVADDVPPLTPVRIPQRTAGQDDPAGPTATDNTAGPDSTTGPAPHDHGTFAFEVQYDLDTGEPSAALIDTLRADLAALGDSVAVVGIGGGHWRVHAHVDDVGAAIEVGLAAGRPRDISVVRFADQSTDRHEHPQRDPFHDDVAVLAVAPGPGLAALFEDAGVAGVRVVPGGVDDLPGAADVEAAITSLHSRQVVLLTNAARIAGVAEAAADAARDRGVRVSVVPTRSPVQALAAIAVHDAARRFDDDVIAMAEAAAATRHAEITVARSEALTAVGVCQPGDILGLIDDEVVYVGRGLLAVAFGVLDRLLGVGAEMITVLVGRDAPHRAGELVEAHVRGRSPFTDVHVYAGGQPDHPLIIGVE